MNTTATERIPVVTDKPERIFGPCLMSPKPRIKTSFNDVHLCSLNKVLLRRVEQIILGVKFCEEKEKLFLWNCFQHFVI